MSANDEQFTVDSELETRFPEVPRAKNERIKEAILWLLSSKTVPVMMAAMPSIPPRLERAGLRA